jgi:hypothetical protein
MPEPRRYRVYLLRLWQAAGKDGQLEWRAALEDARTGERHGFAALAQLCAFLEAQTAGQNGRDADPPVPKAGCRAAKEVMRSTPCVRLTVTQPHTSLSELGI